MINKIEILDRMIEADHHAELWLGIQTVNRLTQGGSFSILADGRPQLVVVEAGYMVFITVKFGQLLNSEKGEFYPVQVLEMNLEGKKISFPEKNTEVGPTIV